MKFWFSEVQGTSGGIYDRGYNTPGPYPMSPGQHEPLTNVPSITNNPMRASVVPSMEDIVKNQNAAAREMENLTPRKVLSRLQQGNARFWMGVAQRPEMSAMERRAMIMQQFPKVAVLGCSDSRVPIEIVFDQGLGDVFAIRVAGNATMRFAGRTRWECLTMPSLCGITPRMRWSIHWRFLRLKY